MSLPKVSLITVVKNGEQFIGATIRSVLAQRYHNLEYIVVDGESTDRTLDIIKSHESGIFKWISERDDGIADAFNKGLAYATGDYIMFLNADDELADTNVVDSVATFAIEHQYPDVLYGDCDLYDRVTGQRLYRARIEYDRKSLLRGRMLPHPGMFVHQRYFKRFGLFDPSFRVAMDFELLIRGVPELGATHVPVLVTRVRTGGLSTRHRSLVVEEVIRGLIKNRRFRFWFEPLLLRNRYAIRHLLRRLAESLGVYEYCQKAMRKSYNDRGKHGLHRSA